MRFEPTPIAGVWTVETAPRGDARGRLTRLFCADTFAAATGRDLRFVQVNHTTTARRGTVRGLHYQHAPHAETKLIRCIRGRVWDVAVDLRRDSPTYGRWHAVELADDNERQILIPEGCAHGFQALTDDAQLLYQHTAAHAPAHEAGVRHDDARLAIAWPLPVALVSERDLGHPTLADLEHGALTT
jgi:dTDP-4-dehydrorhamnose 3,5-epimerase